MTPRAESVGNGGQRIIGDVAGPIDHSGPLDDKDVPAFLERLGLTGLVDVHVHFLPDRMQDKVWAFFDHLAPERYGGGQWPITYRGSVAERLATLAALRVEAFTALVYPHKPGMARWLNGWARDFAARTPGCLSGGTFFPEPDAVHYVRQALDDGARVMKVHLQVGGFDPREPVLDPVWGLLAEAGTPVVTHCGSGPAPAPFTGPGPIGEVLARHPDLRLVVAHLGMPDYADFLELLDRHRNVHLDTTMAFTDFVEATMPYPRDALPRLAAHGDRIVLGSDFPTIPHTYAHQLRVLAGTGLGEDWLRAVLHDNGARLLGLPTDGAGHHG